VAGDGGAVGPTGTSGDASSSSSSSSSDSDSDDSDSDSDDSDSSSSDADSAAVIKKEKETEKEKAKTKTEQAGDDSQVTVSKKRRTSEGGASVATQLVINDNSGPSGGRAQQRAEKPARKANVPFRRVDPDKVLGTEIMMDNRYTVKVRRRVCVLVRSD
jgi:hypothetical protein